MGVESSIILMYYLCKHKEY